MKYLLIAGLFLTSGIALSEDHSKGAAIYRQQCAECHGKTGQGVEGLAEDPLVGTRNLESLTGRIERTMPEEEPELCVGPDAKAVAKYIYDAFYSVEARAKKKPARIELARLTVPQYRNSAVDLVSEFLGGHLTPLGDKRGLTAIYEFYAKEDSKKIRAKSISHRQIDSEINYVFGSTFPNVNLDPKKLLREIPAPIPKSKPQPKAKPDPKKKPAPKKSVVDKKADAPPEEKAERNKNTQGKPAPKTKAEPKPKPKPKMIVKKIELDPDRFKVRWEGSILAEETGEYEFVIRTRNGCELWVNERNTKKPTTIDGYVVSNNDPRELRKKVFLIGGRAYPITLSFFKRTNQKDKGKKSNIELLWKPPHGVLATIPKRVLLPSRHQESFIPTTSFPADDRSVGYERGTSVSRGWIDSVNLAAIEAADYVGEHLDELARTKPDAKDRNVKIETFSREFLARSQRTLELSETYRKVHDHIWEKAENQEAAVRKIVILAMTSPAFLYPKVAEQNMDDQERIISRLSLALWDSLPNHTLRNKAKTGWYKDYKRVDIDTWRMMEHHLTHAKLRQFFHHWLELERSEDLAKSEEVFPEFSDELMAELKRSLFQFIDEIVWSEKSDYRKLLTSEEIYINEELAKIYPAQKSIKGKELQKSQLKGGTRSGVLTHPYLLTNLAYHDNTSPIHRGVFLSRHILGIALKSPPMANEFLADEFDPHLTMREKVTELTKAENCMGCHSTINPLGFSLESFDGLGRWRTQEKGKPINPKGILPIDSGEKINLQSPADVANFAVTQPSAHLAFVESLFHHTVKQPATAYETDRLNWLRDSFEKQNFSILDLLKQIAFTSAIEGIETKQLADVAAVRNKPQ